MRIAYCVLLQVEPDALFQLLLALSQKCSDDLQILDLVEGDKPLMPLVCFQSSFYHNVYKHCWVKLCNVSSFQFDKLILIFNLILVFSVRFVLS